MKKQSNSVNPGTWVSDSTLARELDVSRQTIWKWTKQGRLPKPVRLSPGCTRWNWEKVQGVLSE